MYETRLGTVVLARSFYVDDCYRAVEEWEEEFPEWDKVLSEGPRIYDEDGKDLTESVRRFCILRE